MSRAGRKRDALKRREANGRVIRASTIETIKEVRSVALEARRRVLGIPKHLMDAVPETSFLGRLAALGLGAGGISRRQYQAALAYQEVCEDLRRFHPVKGFPHPGDLDRSHGHDNGTGKEPAYIKKYRDATDKFNACEQVLKGSHSTDIRLMSITKMVVLDGIELPEEVPTLRMGLDALASVPLLKVAAERFADDEVKTAEVAA